jgi:phosphatidate cytidylyltransferase
VLGYVFVVWTNDVFAYLVGANLGRHHLCERLSPKKSWEGFFGGLIGALVMGLLVARLLHDSYLLWLGLALVTGLSAVAGDLVESMFKRASQVKDSGTMIPGHGGVLDRFDAMLLSAPCVFIYLLICKIYEL